MKTITEMVQKWIHIKEKKEKTPTLFLKVFKVYLFLAVLGLL